MLRTQKCSTRYTIKMGEQLRSCVLLTSIHLESVGGESRRGESSVHKALTTPGAAPTPEQRCSGHCL
ncbi:unnamed protein product, partial [Iphiclides podalirius]